MKLFGGSAHPTLTQEVAQLLSLPVAKSEFIRFGDSEIRVTIQEDVKDEECVIIQPTSRDTDTHWMELFFYIDALKRGEAAKIIGVIPYFGYARQNAQHRPGEAISLNVVVRILEMMGMTKIITFDFHEPESADMFSIPFENLSAFGVLADVMKKEVNGLTAANTTIVAPDNDSGVERANIFSKYFFGTTHVEVGSVEKKRDLNQVHQSKAINIFADVKGKHVILVDDIITSGGTLINAATLCLERGAIDVYSAITHPDFLANAPQKLQNSAIKTVYASTSIPLDTNQKFAKLREVSIASTVAKAIRA